MKPVTHVLDNVFCDTGPFLRQAIGFSTNKTGKLVMVV